MGLDVALEEINHLLEVDLTDNSRPRHSAEGRHHIISQNIYFVFLVQIPQQLQKGLHLLTISTSIQLMKRFLKN